MSAFGPDSWQRVSPYLDKALGMSDEERARLIHSLRKDDPALAEMLNELLDEHGAAAKNGFLEQRPPGFPNAAVVRARDTLGPYMLLSHIGQGGMGTVWLASRTDGRFERLVAIKFLNAALTGL